MSNPIITLGEKIYEKNILCQNDKIINILKTEQRLDPVVNYELVCPLDKSYIAGKLLGKGAFNEVYSIVEDEDPAKVLRITNPELNDGEIMEEISGLFLQSYMSKTIEEGGIGCINICKVYDFGTIVLYDNDKIKEIRGYAILEKLTTSELTNEITKRKGKYWMNFLGLKPIFKGVLTGLNCIHSNEFVHLDIKPQNIGLDSEGNAKIFDFGFARHLPNGDPIKVKGQSGTRAYSDPTYMSYYGVEKPLVPIISINSDIYALGVILLDTYFKYDDISYHFVRKNKKDWDNFEKRSYYENKHDKKNPELLKQLMRKLLVGNPLARYTSEEALRDPWFSSVKGGKKRKTLRPIKRSCKSRKTKK